MTAKKFISLILIFLFLLPPTQGWSQPLEEQAQYYLQRVGPADKSELPAQRPQAPPAPKVMTTAPRQPEETSAIEARAAKHGLLIKQFGYSFFYQPPASFLPVQNVPVGPDYVIGPGDTVRIVIWGSVQGNYQLTVDRNGNLDIPKVGVVHVSSLNYQQLREVLDREFARQYTNFQMNVTLDNLRTITVYVVGQARFPGSYAVSSLSTLVSALFASGGPSKAGSLRHIQVRRRGKVIAHFDMYDLLLRGDKSKDIRLLPEDVIFIPPIGPLAAIGSPQTGGKPGEELKGGPVKIPGIYELKRERTLDDLLRLAGGLGDTAFKGRVQVLRVQGRQEMVLFDEDLQKYISQGQTLRLVDGDLVQIFPVPDLVEKKVVIAGAVKNPGEYGYSENLRVKDLIGYAGGLLLYANKDEAEISRVAVTPEGPATERLYFRPFRALAGKTADNLLLKPYDYVFIRPVPDWNVDRTVTLTGEVKYPGTYALRKGEHLSSVLARAGGFTDLAYPLGAVLTRGSTKAIQKQQLKLAIDRLETQVLSLSAARTGAELEAAEAKRSEVMTKQQLGMIEALRKVEPMGRIIINLTDPEILRGAPEDIILEAGDQLMIPERQNTVNVVGAVFNPTAIVYAPYRTVSEYITMAGGTTKIADDKEVYVIKVNGAAVSRKGFKWLGNSWDGNQYVFHVGGLSSLRLDAGDTIVIPEQLERIEWLRQIKDIATIIGQIALTAGIVLVGLK